MKVQNADKALSASLRGTRKREWHEFAICRLLFTLSSDSPSLACPCIQPLFVQFEGYIQKGIHAV